VYLKYTSEVSECKAEKKYNQGRLINFFPVRFLFSLSLTVLPLVIQVEYK